MNVRAAPGVKLLTVAQVAVILNSASEGLAAHPHE